MCPALFLASAIVLFRTSPKSGARNCQNNQIENFLVVNEVQDSEPPSSNLNTQNLLEN